MERGRTCGLFFRHPHAAAPAATALAATAIPYGNRPMKLASIPLAAAALRHRPARIAPYAFSFRRMHAISPLPGNICPKCMLFEIGMARSSPYASISRCNRVVLDTWRKDLAGKVPFSRRETRNHAWHEDAARAFGLQSGQKKIGSPNGDPINELFGFTQRLSDALQPLHQAEELAFSCLGGIVPSEQACGFPSEGIAPSERACAFPSGGGYASGCTEGAGCRCGFLPGRITPSERTCAFLPGSQHPTEFQGLRCRPWRQRLHR